MKVPDWVLRLLLRQLAERGAMAAGEDLQLYPGENFGSLARWAMLELSAGIPTTRTTTFWLPYSGPM